MRSELLKKLRATSRLPFVRGAATFQVGSMVMLVTGFASSIVYARLLGLKEFGMYAIVSAFVGIFGILASYGQESTTVIFLSEAVGKKDNKAIANVLRYYVHMTLLSSIVYLCIFILAPTLADALQHNALIGQYARLVILNILLQPANTLLFLLLQLERRIKTVVTLENGLDIAQLAVSIALLLLGWGVQGILIGTLSVSAAAFPFLVMMYNKSAKRQGLPTIWQTIGTLGKAKTGGYVRQGFWIALDQNIGKNLYPNLFYIVLSATASLETVGIFRLAMRLAGLPLSLIMPSVTRMTSVTIPKIANSDSTSLFPSIRKVLAGTLGLVFLISCAAAIIIPPLIPFVYGTAFSKAAPIFLVLLVPNFLSSAHVLSVPLLRLFKRVWMISLTNLTGMGIAVVCYFFLLKFLSAIWAISISVTIFQTFSLLLFVFVAILLRDTLKAKMYHPR